MWLVVCFLTGKIMGFELGNRKQKTFQKLWDRVGKACIGAVCTDYLKAYKSTIPSDQLIQSKANTWFIESVNSLIRHYLARCIRRGKCYSKSLEMLDLTMVLFINKYNNRIINSF